MNEKSIRITSIDILKAIACLCVLIGHVINGIIKAEFIVSPLLYHLYKYVYLFHVPCFFFASGYLYANKKIDNWKEYVNFVSRKFIALGIPYLSCSIFYVFFSSFLSSEMNANTSYAFISLFYIWKTPIALYWYLYALLEIFIFVPMIEILFSRCNKIFIWAGFIMLAFIVHSDILFINYITQYSYLFYMGVIFRGVNMNGVKRYIANLPNLSGGGICIGGIALYFIYASVSSLLPVEVDDILKNIITSLLVIIMFGESFVILERKRIIYVFFMWISNYMLYVYLFHTCFSGTIRVVLRWLGVTNCWLHTIGGIVIGLAGPILLAKFIRKIPILRFWIEPLSVIRKTADAIK